MSRQQTKKKRDTPSPRLVLSWKINLVFFGLLVLVIFGVFFRQLDRITDGFRKQALSHSRMVAGIIEENLQNSLLASQVIDETVRMFLLNSAEFIHYLDGIEPFNGIELESFARESGLAGITIIRAKQAIAGPSDWLVSKPDCEKNRGTVNYLPRIGLATLVYGKDLQSQTTSTCLVVGIDSGRILELRQKTSLASMLGTLSSLPGVSYVRMDNGSKEMNPGVQLVDGESGLVAETHLSTQAGFVVIGLKTGQYRKRVDELRKEFILFSVLLIVLGAGSSWLLYRYQAADIVRTQEFERTMAKQNEEAALGRATATITHEIRNPMNAINIGLQRLVMESDNLSEEQEQLLSSMRESVKRTDNILSRLQRFSTPLHVEKIPMRLDTLLSQTATLYEEVCKQQSIKFDMEIDFTESIAGDRDLLGEMFDNLMKNSIEAQPQGGFLSVSLSALSDQALIRIENGGFTLSRDMIDKMMKPYFTTKARGTGLGLALVKRIIELHQGTITIEKGKENDSVAIEVLLPTT